MYQRFDVALSEALFSENALYGHSERSVATAAARRAATENRIKAMNEATLGKVGFAAIHDTASTRYHEDAELMADGKPPVNHAIGFYLATAKAHRKADAASEKAYEEAAPAAPPKPRRERKRKVSARVPENTRKVSGF